MDWHNGLWSLVLTYAILRSCDAIEILRCAVQSKSKIKAVTLMTPDEVADQLKVSIFTVRRWIHQGELPAYRIGRGWRIGSADLDQWLETHRQPNESQPA